MVEIKKKETETFETFISRVAGILLNCSVRNTEIRPVDIEIYLYHEAEHSDDTAQRHPLQLRYNQFYFYRAGKSNSLRPVNRMGAGVSFSTETYSLAVLLRGIVYKNEVIRGTSFVARFIYSYFTGFNYNLQSQEERLNGIESIERLTNVLTFETDQIQFSIHQAERVGLNLKKDFAKRKYRFYTQ